MQKIILIFSYLYLASCLNYTGIIKVGEEGTRKNPVFFPISGTCQINSGSSTIDFKVLSGWIKINGKKYTSGESDSLQISAGQVIHGQVGGFAQGWGKNAGPDEINYTCSGDIGLLGQFSEEITETKTINPGSSTTIRSPLFWSASIDCKVTCAGSNIIQITNMDGSIKINNTQLGEGESMNLTVSNGDEFIASLSGHAEAEFHDYGSNAVTCTCSTNLNEEKPVTQLSRVVSLPAGKSKEETSPVFWAVSGTCTVLSPTQTSDEITFKVISGKAWFGKGNSATTEVQGTMSLNVTAGDKFTVKVGGDATGELTNNGKETLTANCTADLSEENLMSFLQ